MPGPTSSKLLFGTLLLLSPALQAQSPQLTIPTAAEVAATWRSPPSEYGPQPYVDLSGAVSQPEVQRDLDEI